MRGSVYDNYIRMLVNIKTQIVIIRPNILETSSLENGRFGQRKQFNSYLLIRVKRIIYVF